MKLPTKLKRLVNECRKALLAGLLAGLTAFQAGGTLQTSIIAGLIVALGTWVTPNALKTVGP